jgi:hypothetical protein
MDIDFSANNSHTQQVRKFRKLDVQGQHGVLNRLRSILNDQYAVTQFYQKCLNKFPIFANKRCGQWYVLPKYNLNDNDEISNNIPDNNGHNDSIKTKNIKSNTIKSNTCYFKSTDGHYHVWDFSTTRLNISLFTQVLQSHTNINLEAEFHNFDHFYQNTQHTQNNTLSPSQSSLLLFPLYGGFVIDSTRKGKEFPDSFSRTVPIWSETLNYTFLGLGKNNNKIEHFEQFSKPNASTITSLTPAITNPPWISGSESDQINNKIQTTHINRFLTTIGHFRYCEYFGLFEKIQPRNYFQHYFEHSPSILPSNNNTLKLEPLWIHRESAGSTIHVLNQNLYITVCQIIWPIICNSGLQRDDVSQNQHENNKQIDSLPPFHRHRDTILAIMLELITKYNIGLYINLVGYYNCKGYLYSEDINDQNDQNNNNNNNPIEKKRTKIEILQAHFEAHFAPLFRLIVNKMTTNLNNDITEHIDDKTIHVSIIATIMTILQFSFSIPIILFSASLVDRFNRTYAGENTAQWGKHITGKRKKQIKNNVKDYDDDQDKNDVLFVGNMDETALSSLSLSSLPFSNFQQFHFYCPFTFQPVSPCRNIPIENDILSIASPFPSEVARDDNLPQNLTFKSGTSSTHELKYRTTHDYLTNNKKNQCRDVNYIPGAGDDEETWAKVKVWLLKPRQGGVKGGHKGDNDDYGLGNADVSDAYSQGDNGEDDCDEDDDDYDDYGDDTDGDEYDSLSPMIFKTSIQPKLVKYYKRILLEITFDMLYKPFYNTDHDDKNDDENVVEYTLCDILPSVWSNEDCWGEIYRHFYRSVDSHHDDKVDLSTDSEDDDIGIDRMNGQEKDKSAIEGGICKLKSKLERIKTEIGDLMNIPSINCDLASEKFQNKHEQQSPRGIQFEPFFQFEINLDQNNERFLLQFNIMDVQNVNKALRHGLNLSKQVFKIGKKINLLSSLRSKCHPEADSNGGNIKSHAEGNSEPEAANLKQLNQPVNHILVLEAQNSSLDPYMDELFETIGQTAMKNGDGANNEQQEDKNELNIGIKKLLFSTHRTNKLTILHNASNFLGYIYDIIQNDDNRNQNDHSNSLKIVNFFLTNSTPELSATLIIILVLFLSSSSSSSVAPSISNPPQDDTNPNTLPSHNPLFVKHHLTQTPSPYCSFTHPIKLPQRPISTSFNTTGDTFTKQEIRQVMSHLIAILSPQSATGGIFLSRDIQQQLNQFFCPPVVIDLSKKKQQK